MAVKRGGLGKGLDSMIPMSDSGAIRKKKTAQTSVQDAVKGEKICLRSLFSESYS